MVDRAPVPTDASNPLPVQVQTLVVHELATRSGNRSVQRFLASPVAQRAVGDGHDLRSPRFAGDPVLEACFDDKARLAVGATGAAVGKVQQALIDLGFDLGPGAADSIYGESTAAAVRQFKAKFRLGFETFGDVGPGTMRKLDELLPDAPVRPPEEPQSLENTAEECPVDDEVVTALQEQGVGQTTLSSADVGAPAAGAGHQSMFDAVRKFKQRVNVANPVPGKDVTDKGQFFWGATVQQQLDAEITALSGPGTGEFRAKAAALVEIIRLDPDDPKGKAGVNTKLKELDDIVKATKDPDTQQRMRAILDEDRATMARIAGNIISTLWSQLNADPSNKRPSVSGLASIRTFRRIRSFEIQGCFDHVGKIAQRLRLRGGLKPVDSKARAFTAAVVGTRSFFNDRRPILFPKALDPASINEAVDPTGDSEFMMGDVFHQQGVSSVVTQMRRALDAGQLLHVRVISGVGSGEVKPVDKTAKRTQGELRGKDKKGKERTLASFEEHSVLVIGFDGDIFVFNDPDASQSHSSIGGFTEPGFGFLCFDAANDRLGTGLSPSGMPVDKHGHTRRGEKRYQAVEVIPI